MEGTSSIHRQNERARRTIRSLASSGSLAAFIKHSKPDYRFNWHHELIIGALERWVKKSCLHHRNIIVSIPPRMGKSEICSVRVPPFIFGLNPKANVIGTSYSAGLASQMNRSVQRAIEDPRYAEIFPDTRIPMDNVKAADGIKYLKNNDIFEIMEHRGMYRSAGVGGGITGIGADYIIVDDPIKNQAEADSPVYREKVWQWFLTTLFSRREKDCSMLVIMTRWHEDDLAGRLLAQDKRNRKIGEPTLDWMEINLPMVAGPKRAHRMDPRKPGEVMWPDKYDEAAVGVIKSTTMQEEGSRGWHSIYQQSPVATEGGIIKREWVSRDELFYVEHPHRFDEMIQSWDLTFRKGPSSAFVVGQVWGRIGALRYLLDEVRFQGGYIESVAAIRQLTAKWPKAFTKLIERKANGDAVIDSLKREIPGIIGVDPRASKEERLQAVSPDFESGCIRLPSPSRAPWIGDWINEVCSCPGGKYWDRADATSQALMRFREAQSVLNKMVRM